MGILREIAIASLVAMAPLVAFACGPDSSSRDAAAHDAPKLVDANLTDAKLIDAPPPDAAQVLINCSLNDLQCPQGTYMNSCTGGKCFYDECCCPTSQQCRAGSFPVCCPDGEVCKNTANGMCGPP